MDFFDKLSASVSNKVKQASDSAKVYADKNRIRKDISAMENELRNRFRDIGEMYYAETKDQPDPEFAEMFAELTNLRQRLADKQRELEALDGIVACPGCGKPIPLGSKFCPNCGMSAPEPPVAPTVVQQNLNICAFCGQPLEAGAVFCAGCGNRVPTAVAQPTAPSPFAPQAPAAPVVPPTPEVPAVPAEPAAPANQDDIPTVEPEVLVCPNCGEPIEPDALFCACCGNKVPGLD